MARIEVTLELANAIKSIRLQHGIQAKDVAQHIHKTPAYISKLEKAQIKTIDEDVLNMILLFISNNQSAEDLTETIAETITHQNQSLEEINKQIWFINFDTVFRRLPIPVSLINLLNNTIETNKIDRTELVNRMNANEGLTPEDRANDAIEVNRWYLSHNNTAHSIKISVTYEYIFGILDGAITFAPYVFVYCILYYVTKIIKFDKRSFLSDDECKELEQTVTQILNEHKFFTIVEKEKMLEKAKTDEQLSKIWNSFDLENQNILSDILAGFKYASDIDIGLTNDRLESFRQNLHWDLWFMLRIISSNFLKLDELSTTLKKQFIDELDKLIDTYSNLPKPQKTKETY